MLALSFLGFATATSALAIQTNVITNPYPLADISWTAPAEHGNVTFTGSHAEVIAQIAALVPRWQSNETYFSELVNNTLPDAMSAAHGLEKRSNRVDQTCGNFGYNTYAYAAVDKSMSNLKYILTHYGTGQCTVNARSCGRFSCSYNNAIVMCNDNNFQVSVDCQTLAQNAFFIIQNCLQDFSSSMLATGQAFYINPSYNVLVKRTDPGMSC